MYAGHFASALVLKTARPDTPTWALVAGAGLLDLLFGVFVAIGLEGAAPDWSVSHRLHIPWSHSLAMALIWAGLFAALFRARGRGVMLVLFAAVMSHWGLDVLVHRPDMELWPYSPTKLGLYDVFGPVSGWAEITLVLVASLVYAARARVAPAYGRYWLAMPGLMAVFLGLGYLGR